MLRSARPGAGSAPKADLYCRERGKTRLETPLLALEKGNSPLNCTYSHCSRINFGGKEIATNFFNEIKDLGAFSENTFVLKTLQNEVLSETNECFG
jgi:hypothetical protein